MMALTYATSQDDDFSRQFINNGLADTAGASSNSDNHLAEQGTEQQWLR